MGEVLQQRTEVLPVLRKNLPTLASSYIPAGLPTQTPVPTGPDLSVRVSMPLCVHLAPPCERGQPASDPEKTGSYPGDPGLRLSLSDTALASFSSNQTGWT